MAVHFHEEDLPAGVLADGPVAVDTETMGLITARDRLCLVQISDGGGAARFDFQGDSDAMIVRGLIAVLHALYGGLPVADVAKVDAAAELARLGLDQHLSSQRSNGLRAMVERIRRVSAEAA